MQLTEQNQAFQRLLLIFADFFKFPDSDFYKELISGELDQEIHQLSQSLDIPLATNFKDFTGTYDELVETYNHCFLGIKTPFSPPVESVYKVWTRDDSFQVPHKNKKGYLMGDSALHVRHILESLNIEIPPEYKMMPDHLTILLELYGYFYQQGLEQERAQFKSDHLDWLPDFHVSLNQLDKNQPYKTIVEKLIELLAHDSLEVN